MPACPPLESSGDEDPRFWIGESKTRTFEVTDGQIMEAMRLIVREAHVIPEPSGATPVAASLTGNDVARLGKKVVFVISDGNVSLELLRRVLGTA